MPEFEYSHRDLRAQGEVAHAFWAMVGAVGALVAFALLLPRPLLGVVGVVALAALGVGYLGWSDRMLDSYMGDLRLVASERAEGFQRAEHGAPVAVDRDIGRPTERSPHSRRRYRSTAESMDESLPRDRVETGQL